MIYQHEANEGETMMTHKLPTDKTNDSTLNRARIERQQRVIREALRTLVNAATDIESACFDASRDERLDDGMCCDDIESAGHILNLAVQIGLQVQDIGQDCDVQLSGE